MLDPLTLKSRITLESTDQNLHCWNYGIKTLSCIEISVFAGGNEGCKEEIIPTIFDKAFGYTSCNSHCMGYKKCRFFLW